MIHRVYTAALGAALLAAAPSALYRRVSRGVPLRLAQRLGYGPPRAGRPCGWIHAVSVGESIAAAPIVDGLRRLTPDLPLVMTTVTETGARVVGDRFRGAVEHRFFPLDFPGAARRAIEAINPAFVVCMETELWPNVLRVLARRGVPVMIANGRVSDRSYPRYHTVRRFLGPVLADVRVFAMQSEVDARRIVTLGAPVERVFVTGNVKHEASPDAMDTAEPWRERLGLEASRRLWIAGSTHRGEEEIILLAHERVRACFPDLALIVAPRHPERAPEVLKLIRGRGLNAVLRTELPRPGSTDSVIVLDTVGELASIYALGDVVFVGGSLVPAGGHNVLEPALRGKPVLFGPHTANFREAAGLLVAGDGGRVVRDADELVAELTRWLGDAALRAAVGTAAQAAAASRQGAVRETLDLIQRFLLKASAP
jgi:3-deoxy-D-manno-octulosonic-acid transferase